MTAAAQPTLWDFVPPTPGDAVFEELVRIAWRLSGRPDIVGVTVGEIVHEYERTSGKQLGGVPMENKVLEQRQTSWLPRVPKTAGLTTTEITRRSPVPRHHKHRHTVWVRPEVHP